MSYRALAITDILPNGRRVTQYAEIVTGDRVGRNPVRYYINGICEGNREGFTTWFEAARYVNVNWPDMPIKGSPA